MHLENVHAGGAFKLAYVRFGRDGEEKELRRETDEHNGSDTDQVR